MLTTRSIGGFEKKHGIGFAAMRNIPILSLTKIPRSYGTACAHLQLLYTFRRRRTLPAGHSHFSQSITALELVTWDAGRQKEGLPLEHEAREIL